MLLGRQLFGGTKFMTPFYKFKPLNMKFGDDRPSNLGDYTLKKEKKK